MPEAQKKNFFFSSRLPDSRPYDRRDAGGAAILGLAGAALVLHRAFLGEVPFADDLVNEYYPHFSLFLRDGGPPGWNPYLFTGLPFLADIQNAAWHPFMLLFRFLAPWWATVAFLAAGFTCAAVGASWLASPEVQTRVGRLLAGGIYAFSGFLIVHHVHPGIHLAAALLPWGVGATQRALGSARLRDRLRWIGLGAIAFASTLAAGHLQLPLYAAFAVAIVSLFSRGPFLKALSTGAAIGVLGAAIAAVALVPLALWLPHSARPGQASLAWAISWSLVPPAWPMILAPDLFGRGSTGSGGGGYLGPYNYWEMTSYLGVLPLLSTIAAAPLGWRLPSLRPIVALGVIGAVIAIGPFGGLHVVLFYLLPGYGMFRDPNRAWILTVMMASVLTPVLLERLAAGDDAWVARGRRLAKAGGRVAIGVAIAALLVAIFWAPWRTLPTASAVVRAVALLAVASRLLARPDRRTLAMGIAIVAVDLALQWTTYLPTAAPSAVRAKSALIDGLPARDPHARVLEIGYAGDPEQEQLTATTDGVIFAGARSLRGYQPLLSGAYLRAWVAREPQPARYEAHWPRLPRVDLPFFRALGQRWLLTPENGAPIAGSKLLRTLDGQRLWELDAPLARAFVTSSSASAIAATPIESLVRDDGARIEWVADDSDRVVLRVSSPRAGALVLGDAWAPGWTVRIDDGPPTPAPRAAEAFRGVDVAAGAHEVAWAYRTPGLAGARVVSAIALVAAIALAMRIRRRE
jgi:hypothetical protein